MPRWPSRWNLASGQSAPPILPFALPHITDAEIAEVVDTLHSGWLATGPKTKRFEREFAEVIGVPHAIALSSATAAMHLALEALGLKPGDEVIVPVYTFTATAAVIVHCGAQPVFVDVDPVTCNIDPAALEAAITPRTRARYGGAYWWLGCRDGCNSRADPPASNRSG